MTGQACGLGCELPAGHEGWHGDLDGNTWPQTSEERIAALERLIAIRIREIERTMPLCPP